jgi:hypothetical protein
MSALRIQDDALVLDADFEFELGPRLEEALDLGIPLYFVVEFELTRSRWYWLDEKVVQRSQKWRLWYHALTRQYRLSSGNLHQAFDTLEEARRRLSRTRGWVVADAAPAQPDRVYQAQLRMRLDSSELPKPFQASALANREWKLASYWGRFSWPTCAGGPMSLVLIAVLGAAAVLLVLLAAATGNTSLFAGNYDVLIQLNVAVACVLGAWRCGRS